MIKKNFHQPAYYLSRCKLAPHLFCRYSREHQRECLRTLAQKSASLIKGTVMSPIVTSVKPHVCVCVCDIKTMDL